MFSTGCKYFAPVIQNMGCFAGCGGDFSFRRGVKCDTIGKMRREARAVRSWEELRQVCEQCQKCELGASRTNLVFGDGNPNAEIMFVGEGPGSRRI